MSDMDTTNHPLEGTIDGEGGVYLHLLNEAFECRKIGVSWHMMKFAVAQRASRKPLPHNQVPEDEVDKHIEGDAENGIPGCSVCEAAREKKNEAGIDLMAVMHDLILKILKPRERERFEAFMEDPNTALGPSELEDAIGEALAEIGGKAPKEKTRSTSSPSSALPENTKEKSPDTTNERVTERVINPAKNYLTL